jgi:integrase
VRPGLEEWFKEETAILLDTNMPYSVRIQQWKRLIQAQEGVVRIQSDGSIATSRPEEGWVWPGTTRSGHVEPCSLKRQHRKALKLSKVRPFVLYSFRHTFLTRLGESGCDAWTLARIAGHSSISISARYVHPSEDAVLKAVDRLGGHKIGHNQADGSGTTHSRVLTTAEQHGS